MSLQFLRADLPFPVISFIEMPYGKLIPAVDLRPASTQRDDQFTATVGEELLQISRTAGQWSITARAHVDDSALSCFVLHNSTILVAWEDDLSFYSPGLQHICSVTLGEIVNGLDCMQSIKSLPSAERDSFIMLSGVKDLEKIESHGMNSHTGNDT